MGSPAATTIQFRIQRDTGGGGFTTLYTSDVLTLPAANSAPFSATILDTPAAGSQTYAVDAIADQGVAPYSGVTTTLSELRR